jgi:GNAT superfamily N-acetyltransferase
VASDDVMKRDGEMPVRLANEQDIPALREVIDASVRGLQAEDYSAGQIDNALKTVFGVDSQLIADRTYFVVEARRIDGEQWPNTVAVDEEQLNKSLAPGQAGAQHAAPLQGIATVAEGEFAIAGCGGWSRRKKLHGGDAWTEQRMEFSDPAVDAAKIRAFFIAPAFARRGVGSLILEACEAAAVAEGFRSFEMSATLTGVKLFSARGYMERERVTLDIGGGERLPVVRMEKRA